MSLEPMLVHLRVIVLDDDTSLSMYFITFCRKKCHKNSKNLTNLSEFGAKKLHLTGI